MAETLISPGVLARENDQSQVTSQPITVGAAIIGPTAKGPVEIPTIVTTYSQYQNQFGSTFISGGQVYTYFTSIAAYNYFANGGESLLVARIVSGTYAPATSTAISSSVSASNQPAFALETLSKGDIMNSFTSASGTNGTLASGSINNFRWQILNSSTSSGTFDLLIRQGNDTTTSPIVLETWTNLSLDPTQANYVAAVLGDQVQNYNSTTNQITVTGSYTNRSNYVRVSSVTNNTPFYFDNNGSPKSQFTSSLPLNASGSFSGGIGNMTTGSGAKYYDAIVAGVLNSQGAVGANYTNMINLLANQDDYRFNVILTPGLIDSGAFASSVTSIITNTQNRGDNIYVVDQVPYGAIVNDAVTAAATRNTSYAATYWPWLQTVDPDSGQRVWVPASTMIGGVYAYNDNVSEPWFAPAGINRGGLSTVIRAEQKLPQSSRDTLYSGKVNPIATFPGTGTVVYGQKTLQAAASALDRVNVRRLLIALKSYISQVANNLVFEQNTIATRNQFLSQVNPYLESVQQRQGLYAFRVIMDDSNNTPDVIDRNQMVGQIYLQPTKTAEFIYLDFNILPTGATFPG
jgi:phage tail sheath protein FI